MVLNFKNCTKLGGTNSQHMFIEQGIKPENKFWKYLIGSVIIIAASTFGQLPFAVAAVLQSMADGNGFSLNSESIMGILEPNLSLFLLMLSFRSDKIYAQANRTFRNHFEGKSRLESDFLFIRDMDNIFSSFYFDGVLY